MKHHPDRDGGNEAKFKTIKEAFEEIERNGFRPVKVNQGFPGTPGRKTQWDTPRSPGNTWRDKDDIGSIFEDLKAAKAAAARRHPWAEGPVGADMSWDGQPKAGYDANNSDIVARVSLRDAFGGFNLVMPKKNRGGTFQNHSCHIPPGTPNGYRGNYNVSDGSSAQVITRIEPSKFRLRSLGDTGLWSPGVRTGDIEMDVEVSSIDLILGAWIDVEDFLGERLRVRIPQEFDPRQRLKVAGKGYYGWIQEYGRPSNQRADMYLKLVPIFKKPTDEEREKFNELYKNADPDA